MGERITVEMIYEGENITDDIAGDLISFQWNDVASGESDDATITLANVHGAWSGEWLPQRGDAITPTIITTRGDNVHRLACGRFTVDDVSAGGPPSVVTIKMQSAPMTGDVRRTRNTRAWEDFTLQDIAQDIATRAGLRLLFDGAGEIRYDRIDQRRESDLGFLARICDEEQYGLKVTDGQLAVYSEELYDGREPATTIRIGESLVISWSFKAKSHDLASLARVAYYDAESGEVIEDEVRAPAQPQGTGTAQSSGGSA